MFWCSCQDVAPLGWGRRNLGSAQAEKKYPQEFCVFLKAPLSGQTLFTKELEDKKMFHCPVWQLRTTRPRPKERNTAHTQKMNQLGLTDPLNIGDQQNSFKLIFMTSIWLPNSCFTQLVIKAKIKPTTLSLCQKRTCSHLKISLIKVAHAYKTQTIV